MVTDRMKDENTDLRRPSRLSQRLANKWDTAEFPEKRRLLTLVCLNFVLKGA